MFTAASTFANSRNKQSGDKRDPVSIFLLQKGAAHRRRAVRGLAIEWHNRCAEEEAYR